MGGRWRENREMMRDQIQVIDLREYETIALDRHILTDEDGLLLNERYRAQIAVDWPTPLTNHQWRLTAQGWGGYIPLRPSLAFRLQPKIPLRNLFGMWEYAYRMKGFKFLEGMADVASLDAFYEQLANVLAKQVLDRARKGFYRAYISQSERLPYVRGRVDAYQATRRPWDVRLPCHFEEHTADIEDNQILTYTLWIIAQSGVCTERVLPTVRRAYRSLQHGTSFKPFSAGDCIGRRYHRLNQDYLPMHALSRFFLDQSGPTHDAGDRQIMPFLVDMAALFELFVAEWLKMHLPEGWLVDQQEVVYLGEDRDQNFRIDLVLRHIESEQPYMVLDTKYKKTPKPSESDIQQVVAYATALHCSEAVLIYPHQLDRPRDYNIGGVHVRTMAFALDGDLEQAGQAFLQELGLRASPPLIAEQ